MKQALGTGREERAGRIESSPKLCDGYGDARILACRLAEIYLERWCLELNEQGALLE